jgi:hypothetical protein
VVRGTSGDGWNDSPPLLAPRGLDVHQVAPPVTWPVNWKDGEDCVVVPSIPTEEARDKFPKGVTEIRPYLRLTPQPNR